MRIFLAPKTGTGTVEDPWRADFDRTGTTSVSQTEVADGWFVVLAEGIDAAPDGTIDCGLPSDPLPNNSLNQLAARLPLTRQELSGKTIGETIVLVLSVGGMPIRPSRDRNNPSGPKRTKVRMGRHTLYDAPAIQGGATDDFESYSTGNLCSQAADWDNPFSNDPEVGSGDVTVSGVTQHHYSVWQNSLGGPDMYSENYCTVKQDHYQEISAFARNDNTNWTFYSADAHYTGNDTRIYRVISGGYTELSQTSNQFTAGTAITVRLEADGSDLSLWLDGTEIDTATDTNITTGNYAGFGMYCNTGVAIANEPLLHSWSGGALGAAFDGSYVYTTAGKRRLRDASGSKASLHDASGSRWEA